MKKLFPNDLPVRGDIYDLDGTLLNSMHAWEDVGPAFLRQLGIAPPHDLNERFRTMSFAESSAYLIGTFSLPHTVEEVMQHIYDAVAEKYRHSLLLKPFAADYIRKRRAQGISMCVATATNGDLARAALQRCGILDCFSFVLSCDEVGVGKDNPAIFLQAAERLDVPPAECCVYEDSIHSIHTAKAAGFAVMGVQDEASAPFWEEIKTVSDWYITSFAQLL